LSGHNGRFRRQGAGIPAAAATLNQERQKQDDVDGEHREENFFESFSPILVRVADDGT
jgi:hypothetical protein